MATLFRVALLALCVFVVAVSETRAQGVRRLPRRPLALRSNQIIEEAAYLSAVGEARILNAQADSMEMDNSIKWVNTYFERRKLNKEAREAENPGYLESLEIRKKQYRRVIDNNLATEGDLSVKLNWMLRDLLANTSYSMFMSDNPGSLLSSDENVDLSADECHQIRVRDANAGNKSPVFHLDTAEMDTRWPPVLRGERFKAARKAYENARDTAISELLTDKEVADATATQLMAAVDGVDAELKAYGRELPKPLSPKDGLPLVAGKRFVLDLVLQSKRLIDTRSAVAFDLSRHFRGKSVGELLQHMMSKGLEFAKAEPGAEAVYGKLYQSLRGYYLRLVPNPDGNGR